MHAVYTHQSANPAAAPRSYALYARSGSPYTLRKVGSGFTPRALPLRTIITDSEVGRSIGVRTRREITTEDLHHESSKLKIRIQTIYRVTRRLEYFGSVYMS